MIGIFSGHHNQGDPKDHPRETDQPKPDGQGHSENTGGKVTKEYPSRDEKPKERNDGYDNSKSNTVFV